MSVILSMKTFKKLEEKLGKESAEQVYELAEAIYEEVEKKTQEQLNKSKVDFADDEYKRLTRKELQEFKEELFERQQKLKEDIAHNFQENKRQIAKRVTISIVISLVNLIGIGWILLHTVGSL